MREGDLGDQVTKVTTARSVTLVTFVTFVTQQAIAYMDSSRFASDCRFGVGYECTRISGLFR